MATWFIIKGVTGKLVLARKQDIKMQTEVVKEFETNGFLEAREYIKKYKEMK